MNIQQQEAEKIVDTIISDLRSRNEDIRISSALRLKSLLSDFNTVEMSTGSNGPSSTSYDRQQNTNPSLTSSFIYNRFTELVTSKDTQVKIDTYFSIKSFVELIGGQEFEAGRFARFAESLVGIKLIAKQAADTLGYLCKPGVTSTASYFGFSYGNAVEGLTKKLDSVRLNSILIIQAYAKYNPGEVLLKQDMVLNGLFSTLKDSNLTIRNESEILLEQLLLVIYHQNRFIRQSLFNELYNRALENLKINSVESSHSAFLIFKALLKVVSDTGINKRDKSRDFYRHPDESDDSRLNSVIKKADEVKMVNFGFLVDKVDEIYEKCWTMKDAKSAVVRTSVIDIIPLLAKFNDRIFTVKYLQAVNEFYMNRLRKDKDRIAILYLFGKISPEVGSEVCLLFANNLIAVIENILYLVSSGESSTSTASNAALSQATETFANLRLNNFSSFNTGLSQGGLKNKKFNDSVQAPYKKNTIDASGLQNSVEYKGQKRYELEEAIFFVIIKLCETLQKRITSVLTVNLINLIVYSCNITKHFRKLLEKLIEYYPNLESFVLHKVLNKVTLILGGCEFIEPGVSVTSLNLSKSEKKKLVQKSVIGVTFDNAAINGNSNNDIVSIDTRVAELRKKIAKYREPYSVVNAPLSNNNFREVSSNFNNYTAMHEAHVVPHHTGPDSPNGERSHFVSIDNLMDLKVAKQLRNLIIKEYGFVPNNSGNSNYNSNVFAAFSKLTGFSDEYLQFEENGTVNTVEFQEKELVLQCFETLCQFGFSKYVSLFEYARYVTLVYTDYHDSEVREMAAKVTAKLFSEDEMISSSHIGSIIAVSEVLSRLLLLGVSDVSSKVRFSVLCNLNSKFDAQLAQADNVRLLLIALNDENFDVCEISARILGRISNRNPAYAIPALRKVLIQYLNDLKYGSSEDGIRNSCSLLTSLVSSAIILTKPHIDVIMETLIMLIRTHKNSIISSIAIRCIGELARVTGEGASSFLPSVVPLILGILKDNSVTSSKRDKLVVVKTLCSLIRNSGKGSVPYFMYPELVIEINKILGDSTVDSDLMNETIRLQGILGALDPYKVKLIEENYKSGKDNKNIEELYKSFVHKDLEPVKPELEDDKDNAAPEDEDYSNISNVAKNWGNPEFGKDDEVNGVDINEMLGLTESQARISKLIQMETPIDLLLLMQLTVDCKPSPSSEDYYLIVVLVSLVRFLKDPSANARHQTILDIINTLFDKNRDKCLNYSKLIVGGIMKAMKNFNVSRVHYAFNKLIDITSRVGKYIRPSVPEILLAVKQYFNVVQKPTTISLVETIAKSLEGEFRKYLPDILPLFLQELSSENSDKANAIKVIRAFVNFGSSIEEYSSLVVYHILEHVERGSPDLRKVAIESIGLLTKSINLSDYSSRIIHKFIRIIRSKSPESISLRDPVMNSMCAIVAQLKSEFFIFLPIVESALAESRYQHAAYTKLIHQLIEHGNATYNVKTSEISMEIKHPDDEAMKPVNVEALRTFWNNDECSSKSDWAIWMRKFSRALYTCSPSIAISSCADLAYSFAPANKALFNSAFVGIWLALSKEHRAELSGAIRRALQKVPVSSDIAHTFLNLSEFLEHNDTKLEISDHDLAFFSFQHRAHAKALHYKELEYRQNVTRDLVDYLININNTLQQTDAGQGLLTVALEKYHFEPKESWYVKLLRWNEASQLYSKKLEQGASDDLVSGKLTALHALGQWEELEACVEENWKSLSSDGKVRVAPLAAAAAWGTGQWNKMDDYINVMKEESANKCFFDAIYNVHRCNYMAAERDISIARESLGGEIASMINESYNRAYDVIVRVQMLSDLEEIIEYKQLPESSPKRRLFREAWDIRLSHCQGNVDIWQRLLNIRSLVVPPEEDLEARIKFANLCRKSGRVQLARKTLVQLRNNVIQLLPGSGSGGSFTHPSLVYAQLKHVWSSDSEEKKLQAFNTLCTFTYDLSGALGLSFKNDIGGPFSAPETLPCDPALYDKLLGILCKCFLKQGQWQMHLKPEWTKVESDGGVLGAFLIPTIIRSDWYKGWHYWALANFSVLSSKSSKMRTRKYVAGDFSELTLVKLHAVPAIKGFFRAIELSSAVALQDLLRLLDLWFAYGGYPEAASELEKGTNDLSIVVWLQVLPQLFSRLHHPDKTINNLLQKLIVRLAEIHPQALLFPLNVAVRSDKKEGQTSAAHILANIKLLHSRLVDEADHVVTQLVKVAVLINEMWYQKIDQAAHLFNGKRHYRKMVQIIDELYQMPRKTFREKAFWAVWGLELTRGHDWLMKYEKKLNETGRSDISLLHSALDCFAAVHGKLHSETSSSKVLKLEFVAPELLARKNLSLAIPGTYESGKTVIRISRFVNEVHVLFSKQRPRHLYAVGSDGKVYDYVLKSQEDIRQDNMVMQLFGLVNKLLDNDPDSFKRHLNVEPYPAIPLSPKSGLLGWVPNSDTLNGLVSQNRVLKGFLKDAERRVHASFAPKQYDNSTSLRKLEMFLVSLSGSDGMDIYQVLWLKSRSSEVWLDRRNTYSRSLASMSMVGYVLGLGDRHPSNIMIHRITGKVIHIDFGDCFEAAALREKWPEKVPFRLTRMLVNGLEASGIEGSYRISLECVARVMRSNSESLLALFESFAHDPLIHWGFDIPTKAVSIATGYVQQEDPVALLAEGKITEEKCEEIEEQIRLEIMNARAEYVLKRIEEKLKGNDYKEDQFLSVPEQVDELVKEATDNENLSQHFLGWCPFW